MHDVYTHRSTRHGKIKHRILVYHGIALIHKHKVLYYKVKLELNLNLKNVQIWNIATNKQKFLKHRREIYSRTETGTKRALRDKSLKCEGGAKLGYVCSKTLIYIVNVHTSFTLTKQIEEGKIKHNKLCINS